jgi:hypothetical protein
LREPDFLAHYVNVDELVPIEMAKKKDDVEESIGFLNTPFNLMKENRFRSNGKKNNSSDSSFMSILQHLNANVVLLAGRATLITCLIKALDNTLLH